jgi:hypothetical protein
MRGFGRADPWHPVVHPVHPRPAIQRHPARIRPIRVLHLPFIHLRKAMQHTDFLDADRIPLKHETRIDR